MIEKSIQEQIALRKLTILKSFKDTTEKPLVTIKQLRNETDCPIYSEEVVKGFINEVNEKVSDSSELQNIKLHLNSLQKIVVVNDMGFREVVYLDKGHMDFDGGGGRQGLVKKQITDKAGRKTSRWVRQGDDENANDKAPQAGEEGAKNPADKKNKKQIDQVNKKDLSGSEDTGSENPQGQDAEYDQYMSNYAKQTDSESLKKYIQNNPDNSAAEYARKELESRGELDAGDDVDDETVDYNNPDSVKFALDAHEDKDAIIDFAITHGVPIGQAMKLHDATKQDHSETHAAIDEAQNSLNSLKEKTGHPETKQSEEGQGSGKYDAQLADVAMSDLEDAMYDLFGTDFKQGIHFDDIDEILSNYDIADPTGESETGTLNQMENAKNIVADLLQSEGVPVEMPEGDFINPGNTKEQAQDRKEFEKENEGGEDKSGDFSGDDSDAEAMLDDLVEGIFNAQGKMDTTKLFDQYMALRDLGLSDSDIEQRVAPGAWEFPNMSEEEREGMKEDWDYAMEAILGEGRKKDKSGAGKKGDVDNKPKDKSDSKSEQRDFGKGNDFFDAYYQMYEEGGDQFVEDINDYIVENDLGMDGQGQEQEFDSLSPKHKKKLVTMMKQAFDSFTRYQGQ